MGQFFSNDFNWLFDDVFCANRESNMRSSDCAVGRPPFEANRAGTNSANGAFGRWG
jgi:hypothetical protein